jgi:hypothetical protein
MPIPDTESLSPSELFQVADKDWLLRKRLILEKAECLLAKVEASLQAQLTLGKWRFPPGTALQSGKISRGENLGGLPYRVLDYPRLFQKPEYFTFRTLFWWGHSFTCSLITNQWVPMPLDVPQDFPLESLSIIYTHEHHPWHSPTQPDDSQGVNQHNWGQIRANCAENQAVRFHRQLPLERWDDLPDFATESLQALLFLAGRSPD